MIEGNVIISLATYEMLKKEKEWAENTEEQMDKLKMALAQELRWAYNTDIAASRDGENLLHSIYNLLKTDQICLQCGSEGSILFDPNNPSTERLCIRCLMNIGGNGND